MSKLHAVMVGLCIYVFALGQGVARAQGYPENTPQACSDRIDNDGDGYVDCYDPDCAAVCGTQQPPPPPPPPPPPGGYVQQPPPPNYYPPPQPVYVRPVYVQPVYVGPVAPRPGIGTIIAGFIFIAVGAGLMGAGIWLVQDGCNFNGSCWDPGSIGYGEAIGGATLATFGGIFAVTGLILVPVGFVQQARYNRWINGQRRVGLIDKIEPVISANPNGGSLGLKLTF